MDVGSPGCRRRRTWNHDQAESGATHSPDGEGALAPDPLQDDEHRSGVRPNRTRIVSLYTDLPADVTVICADELGPVSPRTVPSVPEWSADGHRIKAPLEYSRGPDEAWVYGALRVRVGQAVTFTARSHNTAGYLDLLGRLDRANPLGNLYVIADDLSSHTSGPVQAWLTEHPRVQPVPLPVGACWLNIQEACWRLTEGGVRRSDLR